MPVQPVTNTTPVLSKPRKNKKPNYVKITGYGAAAAGAASWIAAKNKGIKLHKQFAYLAGLLTLAHIAILESYRFIKKKS